MIGEERRQVILAEQVGPDSPPELLLARRSRVPLVVDDERLVERLLNVVHPLDDERDRADRLIAVAVVRERALVVDEVDVVEQLILIGIAERTAFWNGVDPEQERARLRMQQRSGGRRP